MAKLYFEDAEIGTSCTAGPYLVTKNEIIQFAQQYDPVPRHIDEEAAVRSVFWGADVIQRPYLLDLHFVDDPASATTSRSCGNGLG